MDISQKAQNTYDTTDHIKISKKEGQSVDASIPHRRERKGKMEGEGSGMGVDRREDQSAR